MERCLAAMVLPVAEHFDVVVVAAAIVARIAGIAAVILPHC